MGAEPSRRGHWSSPPPSGPPSRSCLWPSSEHSTTSATSAIHTNTPLLSAASPSFADRLSDEVILRIWQYLAVLDIVRLQAVCKRLGRLARDSQIWKRLFIQTFVLSSQASGPNLQSQPPRLPTLPDLHSLLRSPDNFPHTPSIRGLPHQYVTKHDRSSTLCNETHKMVGGEGRDDLQREVGLLHDLDWQALFRVSSNWQRGNFAISELSTHEVKHFDQSRASICCIASNTPSDHQLAGSPSGSTQMRYEPAMEPERAATLVDSVGQFIFIALRSDSHQELFAEDTNDQFHQLPCVKVHRHGPSSSSSTAPTSSLPLYEIRSEKLCITPGSMVPTITDIKADMSSSIPDATEHRLFVAYSSGDWSVFHLKFPGQPEQMPGDLTIRETHHHAVQSHAIKESPLITMSSFHYPILATCSADFSITIYRLEARTKLMSEGTPSVSETTEAITVLRHMQGLSCHWPATMRLSQIPIFYSQEATSTNRRPAKRRRHASPPLSRSNSIGLASTVESFSQMKKQRLLRRQYDRSLGGLPSPPSESQQLESCRSAQKAFRLDVAYSSPSYPDNWAVSLQEIVIIVTEANPGVATVSSRYATARPRYSARVTKGHATSSRCRNRQGRSLERPIAPSARVERRFASLLDSSPGLVQKRITSISNHEGLLVVGLEDHALEVYNISGSRSSLSLGPSGFLRDNPSPDLSLEHRQSLHSYHGSVHSVALNSQRIVSGGKNGDIQVWASPRGDVGRSSSGLAHVITLRSPLHSGASTPNECTGPLTLFQLIRHLKGHGQSAEQGHRRPSSEGIAVSGAGTNVIKWVSTSFDRLLSVVSGPSSCCITGDNSHLDQHHSDTCTSKDCSGTGTRERVQVWNFAV